MSSTAGELDAMHVVAKDLFERGDFGGYRELYSPDLKYRRADGRIVGRDELIRDAVDQFRRFRWVRSAIVRESLDVEGDRAVEVVTRTVSVGVTAFFVVHRTFDYDVRGRYTWRKVEGRWRIGEMYVLEQQVRPGRFSVGLRAYLRA